MTTRNADVSIRYLIDVIDKGLAKALVLTKDMAASSKKTGEQVSLSADLQKKQWAALAQVASKAESTIAKAAVTRSTEVNKSLDRQIAKQREMGLSYDAIIAKQRETGASASALAAAIERSSAKQIAALAGVRREASRASHGGGMFRTSENVGIGRGRVREHLSGAAAVVGIGGFLGYEATSQAVEATVAREKAAQTLALAGISNAHAQALSAGAQALGVPQQTLGVGLKTLSSKTTAALRPGPVSQSTVQPFLDLGVTRNELKATAGDASKTLGLIADKLATAHKGTKAYAAGTALLGRSFATLHPLLEDGSKGLERNTKLAEKYGIITKGPTAQGIKELHDKQVELKFANMGLQTSIATNLTPVLLKVLPVFAKLVHTLADGLKPAIDAISKVLAPVIKFLKSGSTEAKIVTGALIALTAAFVGMKILKSINELWVAFDALLTDNPIGVVIVALAALAVGLVYAYKHSKTFRDIVDKIGSICKSTGKAIIDGLGAALKWVENAFHNTVHFLSGIPGDFKKAGQAIVDAFKSAFNGLKGFIKDLFVAEIDSAITILNLAIKGINKITPGPIKVLGHTIVPGIPDIPSIPLVRKREGGLIPAMVSPGEMLIHPNGNSAMVPGAPVAADNVFAMMPAGTAVMTGHGQSLLASGASLHEAIAHQMPHFGAGGFNIKQPKGKAPAKVNTYFDSKTGETLHMTAAEHAAYVRRQQKQGYDQKHISIVGKVSTFGPPGEPAGQTAYGHSSSEPGIAINPTGDSAGWNGALARSLAGKLFHVAVGGHSGNFRVIDKGPFSHGRKIDITGAAVRAMGFDPAHFPTDSIGHATIAGAGFAATKAPKVPTLSSKDIATPVSAFDAGFQAGLGGQTLADSGLIGQAIKDVAVTMSSAAGAAGSSSPAGGTSGGGKFSLASRLAGHPELKTGVSRLAHTVLSRFPGLSVTSTTGGNHVANSYHYQGRAVDIGGSPSLMHTAAGWVRSSGMAGKLLEGIHNPNLAIKNGKSVNGPVFYSDVWAGHKDHIHLAARRGGILGFRSGGWGTSGQRSTGSNAGSVIGRDIGALTSMPEGTTDGSVGRTIKSIGHWLDVVGGITNARLSSLEHSLKAQIANLRKHHGSDIVIRRLASVLNLIEGEVGIRVGRIVKGVQDAQAKMSRQVSAFGRFQRLQAALGGPAADSAAGLTQAAQEQGVIATSLKSNIANLNKALAVAKKHKDKAAVASITDQISQAQDDLSEAIVTGIEDTVAAAKQAAQDLADNAQKAVDSATHGESLANLGEAHLELQQQLAGTFDTAGGGQERAANINQTIIPAMQAELEAMRQQQSLAANQGNQALADQIGESIAGKQNDILSEQLTAQQAIQANTESLKDFAGSTGFEFNGQQFTDLIGSGVGV